MKRRSFLQHAFESMLLFCGGIYPWAAAQAKPGNTVSRIAFGSCCHQNDPQPIWNTIAAAKPDLFLFIGDNIYADTENMSEMVGKYRKLGAKPEFAEFRSKIPLLATWDDHDYGINDGGAEYPKKEQSKKIFLDFFAEPLDSERRQRPGIYTSYYFGPPGQRLQVILLDLRWFRSPLHVSLAKFAYTPSKDPKATLVGETQFKWLESELKKPADLRLIASSIQFASPEHPWEKWANFPIDKARILDLFDKYKIKNAFFISGDMHFGELSAEKTPGGFEVFDVTSSGMNFFENGTQYKNKNRIGIFDKSPNFGFIEIDWKKGAPKVSLQVRTDKGAVPIRHDVVYRA
jgi:alkaline phosphatase D